MVPRVSEVKRRERETDFSQELVSTKSVPVPHTQPESTRTQLMLFNLSLKQCETKNQMAIHVYMTNTQSLYIIIPTESNYMDTILLNLYNHLDNSR